MDLPAIPCKGSVEVQLWTLNAWLTGFLSDPLGRKWFDYAKESFPGQARRHGGIDLNQLGERSLAGLGKVTENSDVS